MGSQFVKAVNERSCKVIMCMLYHLYTLLSLYASIYENLLRCVEASQSTVLALKFVILCATKNSSFEAIRDGMKKTLESDEHLDFSDETLEQRRIIRMHS